MANRCPIATITDRRYSFMVMLTTRTADEEPGEITRLLKAMTAGTSDVGDRLATLVYAELHVLAVAAIFLSALAKYAAYLGVIAAAYGTAYGLMAITKATMFTALLGFGAGNYWAVRNMAVSPAATLRTRRFCRATCTEAFGGNAQVSPRR